MARMSAEDRREEVLHAAIIEFAHRGYAGTSTEAIARRAGVSQPYLFRLFAGKHDLFLKCIERSFQHTEDSLRESARGLTGPEAIAAMGSRYRQLIADSTCVQFQLQLYSAAPDDPRSRELGRHHLAGLWRMVADVTGEDPAEITRFLSTGMLLNVLAALGIPHDADRHHLPASLDAWARGADAPDRARQKGVSP
ncbi:TetR/AcrR family transcriptional regulator [Mycobacterium malmoense]|nr:TetR/AcrR family transcriptional regulator [Mycobacterium malmoense]